MWWGIYAGSILQRVANHDDSTPPSSSPYKGEERESDEWHFGESLKTIPMEYADVPKKAGGRNGRTALDMGFF